jgi:hypothetical protein
MPSNPKCLENIQRSSANFLLHLHQEEFLATSQSSRIAAQIGISDSLGGGTDAVGSPLIGGRRVVSIYDRM